MPQRVAIGRDRIHPVAVVAITIVSVCSGGSASDVNTGTTSSSSSSSSATPWTPASPALHLFFDLEGLASVDGLRLKQHRAIKPPSGDFVIAPTEPWEPLVFAYDSVVQVCFTGCGAWWGLVPVCHA